MRIYRTTIEIWTKYNPGDGGEFSLEALARDAESGDSICGKVRTTACELDDAPEAVQSFFEEE